MQIKTQEISLTQYRTLISLQHSLLMMMGVLDLVAKDYFPKGSTILALHTVDLQENEGMSERLKVKLLS